MKKIYLIGVGLLLAFLSGCAGGNTAPVASPTMQQLTPTVVMEPTIAPVVAASDSECIACHTDKDTLILTAKPEEEVEEESEGTG